MQINVTGNHLAITTSIRSHIHKKFANMERRLGSHIHSVSVVLAVEKTQHKAEAGIIISGNHQRLFAKSKTTDMYSTIDSLIIKLYKQADRCSQKLGEHSHAIKQHA